MFRRRVEEDGRSLIRDGERLTGSEGGESGSGETKRPAVIGVSGSEEMAGENSFLHETAAVLATANSVLVVELGRRASHVYAYDSSCPRLSSGG